MNDETSSPGRRYFTLRELLVLVTVIALGFAVLVPVIRQRRQRAQRTRCTNNLNLIGLGIQNFHDIRQEICPSYLTDDHSPAALPNGFITWPVLLLDFVEQNGVLWMIETSLPLDHPAPLPPPWMNQTIATWQLPMWTCPARRHLTSTVPFVVGDYANVSLAEASGQVLRAQPRTWDAAMLPSRAFNASTVANTVTLNGFQPGTLGGREHRSMTSFASITDGLSHTIFIGEKGVREDRFSDNAAYLANTALPSHQDGTFYYGRGGNPANLQAPGAMAFWSRRLAPAKPGERLLPAKARVEDPNNRFGGWHEGVTLFLMGDGQVKAISNDTSTLVLQRLGCRNDRQTVEVP